MKQLRATRWLLLTTACGASFVGPSWAQSPAMGQSKTHPTSQAAKAKVKARSVDDLTAQLQAQAVAQAAERANLATKPTPMVMPPEHLPAVSTRRAAPQWPATEPVVDSPAQVSAEPAQVTPQDPPELLIAQQIHQGQLPCELGASVRVEADLLHPGFFHVHGKGFRYRMFPVRTSSGALRLEDKKAGAVWLQLANKSMLMDQKKGRRLADECAHPDQLAYAETMKSNPPPSLIDTTGMGRSILKP